MELIILHARESCFNGNIFFFDQTPSAIYIHNIEYPSAFMSEAAIIERYPPAQWM